MLGSHAAQLALALVVFLVRMWRLNAGERLMLPPERILNRLAPALGLHLGHEATPCFDMAPGGVRLPDTLQQPVFCFRRGAVFRPGLPAGLGRVSLRGRRKFWLSASSSAR